MADPRCVMMWAECYPSTAVSIYPAGLCLPFWQAKLAHGKLGAPNYGSQTLVIIRLPFRSIDFRIRFPCTVSGDQLTKKTLYIALSLWEIKLTDNKEPSWRSHSLSKFVFFLMNVTQSTCDIQSSYYTVVIWVNRVFGAMTSATVTLLYMDVITYPCANPDASLR